MTTSNTRIQIRKSTNSGSIPPLLANGELALNSADRKLYYSAPDGSIVYFKNSDSFPTINVEGTLLLASSPLDILSITSSGGLSVLGNTSTNTIDFEFGQLAVHIANNTPSIDTQTGALTVSGGVGIGGNLVAPTIYTTDQGIVFPDGSIQSTSATVGTIDEIAREIAGSASSNTIYTQGVDTTQNTRLSTVEANTIYIFGALDSTNSNITSANTQLKSYTDGQISTVNSNIVSANTQLKSYVDGAVTSANTQLKSYTDGAISTVNSNIVNANNQLKSYTDGAIGSANNQLKSYTDGAIYTSNTQLKSYTDGQISFINNEISYISSVNSTQNTNITNATNLAQGSYDNSNTKLSLSGGTITGNLNVTGQANVQQRLSVGTGAYTLLPNLIAQFTGTSDLYSQVNQQNLSGKGTGDFVITANNGSDLVNYVDMGMAGSQYDNTAYNSFSAINPNDGYFLLVGNPGQDYGGNVIYGTTTSGSDGNETGDIVFIQGGNFDEVARFKLGQGLVIETNIISSSNSTGALVVEGGIGANGSIFADRLYDSGIRVLTHTDQANTFLQANDALTLSTAKSYTDSINNSIQPILGYLQSVDNQQNTNITSANTQLKSYVDGQISYVSGVDIAQNTRLTTVEANTIYLFGALNQTNNNVVNANTQMKSYVDGAVTSANTQLKSYTDGIVISSNTQMKSYVDGGISYVSGIDATQNTRLSTVEANTIYLFGALTQTNTNIVSANTQLKSYVDGAISSSVSSANTQLKSYTDGAISSSVTSANTQLKSYVDGLNSYLQSVNTVQNTSIGTINSTLLYLQGIENYQNTYTQSAFDTANTAYNFIAHGGTVAGNVSISGNLQVTGNITYTGNVITQTLTGNSAQFFGNNTTGFGALYAGTPTGYTVEPQTVVQLSSNYNGYSQLNLQNENNGGNASTDVVCTADNGTANDTFIDMGINSSLYNQIGYGLAGRNDGYLYVYGNTSTGGGNLIISTMTQKDIIFSVNGQDPSNEVFRVSGTTNNVIINSGVQSTTNSTGALVVNGGVGVTGNVNATGSLSVYNGMYSTGSYSGTYSDGVVVDYVPGVGRISVGSNDGIYFYNNVEGGRTKLLSLQANGEMVLTQALQTASQGIIFSDGTVQTSAGVAIDIVARATANSKVYAFFQNTAPTTANSHDMWMQSDTGVVYENWGTTSAPVWAEFGPSGQLSNTQPGIITGTSLTVSGQSNLSGQIYSTYNGANNGATLMMSGTGTQGGAGYFDFLRANNTVNSSSAMSFRLDNTGTLQLINSAYTTQAFAVTQTGVLFVGSGSASSTNNDATTNYINFNNQNSVIYDDGNFHIHSRGSGQSMWINTNGGDLRLLQQSPVNGGANGTSVIIGGAQGASASGFLNVLSSRIMNYSGYGYLSSGGAGTVGGSSGNVGVGIYCPNRIYSGEVDSTSDERLKDIKGIIPEDIALKFVKNVNGIHYTWKDGFGDDGLKAGFGAQSVHKAGFAHMVSGIPNENVEGKVDDDGWVHPDKEQLNINYSEAIPYHHEVIKNLLNRIEQLEQTIEELKSK